MQGLNKYILVLFAILLLISCRKDEINYEEDIIIVQQEQDDEVGLHGHITDVDGIAMSGVTVTTGDQATVSDEYGYYRMEKVDVIGGTVPLTFIKDNYLIQFKKVTPIVEQDFTFVKSKLVSSTDTKNTFQSTEGGTLTGNQNHKVSFEPNTIVHEDGSDYNGTVIFSSYFIDPTRPDLSEVMSGDLSAIDSNGDEVQLVSFGMLYGNLTSPDGAPLQIKEGSRATVELEIPAAIVDNAPEQIPLWSLDEISATWIEEGIALKEGNKYLAEVDHFSFWNCDAPFPIVEIRGCIVDQDGIPLSNTTILVTITDLGVTRYCTTDRNGCFYGKMPRDQDLQIGVYNDCGQISNEAFGPFTESTDVGVITFDISEFGYTLAGRLLDCDYSELYPGLIEITDNNSAVTLFPTSENGSFSNTMFTCGGSQISIRGIDPSELEAGLPVDYEFTLSQINDVGDIIACGEILDFYIRLSINGELQLFQNPSANRVGSELLISGNNNLFNVNMKLDESDLSNPIKYINVFMANGNAVVFWDEECNDFISFEATETGGLNELVEASLEGQYLGVSIELQYRQIVQNELTPIKGRVWNDLNKDGIRNNDEPPFADVKIIIENPLLNINTNTRTDENGQYTLYGSHLDVNRLELELPSNYLFSPSHVGIDDTVDSDFSNGELQVLIQNAGDISENNDAGIYIDANSTCDNFVLSDPCITGDGDLSRQIVATQTGVNFEDIIVREGGDIVFQSGPQSSPYELFDLSYNIDYNVTCFLDNGIECETNFKEVGTVLDSTFFYVGFVNCDPFTASVRGVPNQNALLGIDYEWSTGSTDDMITMTEGQSVMLTTTSTIDNCPRTYTYTLEKARVALGGVVWLDSPAGMPDVLDGLDTERLEDIRLQLYQEDGTYITKFTTSSSGAYQFYLDLPNGNYYIAAVNIPAGLSLVEKGQGADPDSDSDFNSNGRTDIFTISNDCTQIENIDLGLR